MIRLRTAANELNLRSSPVYASGLLRALMLDGGELKMATNEFSKRVAIYSVATSANERAYLRVVPYDVFVASERADEKAVPAIGSNPVPGEESAR